jgi:hypothetical protein
MAALGRPDLAPLGFASLRALRACTSLRVGR